VPLAYTSQTQMICKYYYVHIFGSTVRTKSYTVPTGSRLVETRVSADTSGAPATHATALVISALMAVTEHEETRATTELGAAQKDTERELSAKLASLKGIFVQNVQMHQIELLPMLMGWIKSSIEVSMSRRLRRKTVGLVFVSRSLRRRVASLPRLQN